MCHTTLLLLCVTVAYLPTASGQGADTLQTKACRSVQATNVTALFAPSTLGRSYGLEFVLIPFGDMRWLFCERLQLDARVASGVCAVVVPEIDAVLSELTLKGRPDLSALLASEECQRITAGRPPEQIVLVKAGRIVASSRRESSRRTVVDPGDFILCHLQIPSRPIRTNDLGFLFYPVSDFRLQYCTEAALTQRIRDKVCHLDLQRCGYVDVAVGSGTELANVLRQTGSKRLLNWHRDHSVIPIVVVKRYEIVRMSARQSSALTAIEPGDLIFVQAID